MHKALLRLRESHVICLDSLHPIHLYVYLVDSTFFLDLNDSFVVNRGVTDKLGIHSKRCGF